MTVKELIEINVFIADLEIEIRDNGVLQQTLHVGPEEGKIPLFQRKQDIYIDKVINDYDKRQECYRVSLTPIPKKWLDLTVKSFSVSSSYRKELSNHHLENLNIVVYPANTTITVSEDVGKILLEELQGQMKIDDWLEC